MNRKRMQLTYLRFSLNGPEEGITLIELSIVLVIIGLIVGGIFVGKDLIEIAQSRKVMSQMEGFQAAVTTFKLKYNCIPGDCAQSSNMALGNSGNGDGFVGSISSTVSSVTGGCLSTSSTTDCFTTKSYSASGDANMIARGHGEMQWFWLHLSNSGLIADTISPLAFANVDISASVNLYWPKDALGKGYLVVVPWNSKLYIRTGFDTTYTIFTMPTFNITVLTASQMGNIASKFGYPIVTTLTSAYPDALAQGQKVVPLGISTSIGVNRNPYLPPTTATPATQFTACAVSDGAGGYRYNIANNGNCNMLWQIDF